MIAMTGFAPTYLYLNTFKLSPRGDLNYHLNSTPTSITLSSNHTNTNQLSQAVWQRSYSPVSPFTALSPTFGRGPLSKLL